jgi:hypothetical protein
MSPPWPAASIAYAPFRINILTHINRDSGILIAQSLVHMFTYINGYSGILIEL